MGHLTGKHEPNNPRICFLMHERNLARDSWVGTSTFMYEALKKRNPNVELKKVRVVKAALFTKLNQVLMKISGLKYNVSHSFYASWYYRKRIKKIINGHQYDAIIAPAMSTAISSLPHKMPLIYVSDATVKLMYNYYEWFSRFTFFSYRESIAVEKKALRNASVCAFSSEWAAQSAIQDYGTDSDRVHVIPFGANLNENEILPFEMVVNRKKGDKCRLLFLGMEWERKGGQIVLDAFQHLRKEGFPCDLTILGCDPPEARNIEGVEIIPFIAKNTPEGKKQWDELMLTRHFLLLPTQAECFGVVFCEASAYGMPSLGPDTGGVSNALVGGKTGFLLPEGSSGKDYAEIVKEVYTHYESQYLPLSKSSRETYDKLLNWDHWAQSVLNLLKTIY